MTRRPRTLKVAIWLHGTVAKEHVKLKSCPVIVADAKVRFVLNQSEEAENGSAVICGRTNKIRITVHKLQAKVNQLPLRLYHLIGSISVPFGIG